MAKNQAQNQTENQEKNRARNQAKNQDEIRAEVIDRGGEVLGSGIFRKLMLQKHHNVTFGLHCIGVAEDSVRIANALEKIGIHADRDTLVKASLYHDLGMLDRGRKYRTNVECWIRHPGEGIENAKSISPSLTDKEMDCILHHMWPALPVPPHTLEGFIVCLADKKSAMREVLRRKKKKTIDPAYLQAAGIRHKENRGRG